MGEDAHTACGACGARFLCGKAGEMDEACHVPQKMARRAVRLSYLWPLLLFLIVLLSLNLSGLSEGWSALSAFAALALYYGTLALLRGRLETYFQTKQ
ncbi:MAG: SoxR reducing system RseC family protein [Bacteroidales bacterium]|nr:SoxR reducing system RseC family protein [Bacteroidales bacterium]